MSKIEKNLIHYVEAEPGQLECVINLRELLPADRERERFEAMWQSFLDSDPANLDIYRKDGNRLVYLTEQLIPTKTNDRCPLLLVLGNPASHSVKAGMFFSFESGGREHRFWKNILRPTGVLDLALEDSLPVEERNVSRRERILNLDYDSCFCIGLTVFISMPSAASGKWSGIAAIKRLIGLKALRRLESYERERVIDCAKVFLGHRGAVVAFQKNAWDNLRSPSAPEYSIAKAKAGKLKGTLANLSSIPLYCIPPTRLAGPARQVLNNFFPNTKFHEL